MARIASDVDVPLRGRQGGVSEQHDQHPHASAGDHLRRGGSGRVNGRNLSCHDEGPGAAAEAPAPADGLLLRGVRGEAGRVREREIAHSGNHLLFEVVQDERLLRSERVRVGEVHGEGGRGVVETAKTIGIEQ